jgi:3-methylfumaryl-CoA hydratase
MTAMPEPADWIGRTRTTDDVVTPSMVARFAATLDRDRGDAVDKSTVTAPQGIHWLCAAPPVSMGELGSDGHPSLGTFFPLIDLPRRMWAASDVTFTRPIRIGEHLRTTTTISAVRRKVGASGPLVFVDVDHTVLADGHESVRERQTLVHRPASSVPVGAGAHTSVDQPPVWPIGRTVMPDSVVLFRYSALTFNGHRIHYDVPYATEVEKYPALVVHGPLMATWLLDLCDREFGPNSLRRFSFRALAPTFVGEPLQLGARPDGPATLALRIVSAAGRVVMTAEAELGPKP